MLKQKNELGRPHGFTLIELLVVIAIIGILSSVVLTSLSSVRAKARDARRISDLKNMATIISIMDDNTRFKKADDSYCAFEVGGDPVAATPDLCNGTPNLSAFFDPKFPTGPTWSGGCSSPGCPYRMAAMTGVWPNPGKQITTRTWCIEAYLEEGVGSLEEGMVHIGVDTNGIVVPGLADPAGQLGVCN